jgi:hypothetical protein
MYSGRDLQILFRLKYLLYDRRFTLEGAKAQLYSELSGDYQDLRGRISILRSELLDLFFFIRRAGSLSETGTGGGEKLLEKSV